MPIVKFVHVLHEQCLVLCENVHKPQATLIFGSAYSALANNAGLLSSKSGLLHRKCLKYLIIWFLMVIGISRQHMKNIGRDAKTDLTNNSLPACVINVASPAKHFATFVTMGRHCSTVGFCNPNGNPKYVKGNCPLAQFIVFMRICDLFSSILIGTRKDFA